MANNLILAISFGFKLNSNLNEFVCVRESHVKVDRQSAEKEKIYSKGSSYKILSSN